jgi:DNA excision repair protein ERCC-5
VSAFLAGLEDERAELAASATRLARATAEITPSMLAEVQDMLRLFGVPYMVAPMEAEAQCAYLEQAGLTMGTITDDSDVFLFGAQRVYRRVCSKSKDAEAYAAADISANLGVPLCVACMVFVCLLFVCVGWLVCFFFFFL